MARPILIMKLHRYTCKHNVSANATVVLVSLISVLMVAIGGEMKGRCRKCSRP
jgi:hypothetical protein